ncbi:MAG: UDP-N-acetylmuramoyl-tripeptide--D-alanyl-D-alanine ligase [bacterium]|nr:UDP-N-acetylmuramoyl-tripeptide--D-alanyl-D-alanine ligase [bacterium]
MKHLLLKILQLILKQLAKLTIWRFQPRVIAITGSVGKTSAKEAIYAVLSASGGKNHRRVRKSEGNLNNELGVPLAIIGEWKEEELKLVSRDTPSGKKKIRKLLFWLKVIFYGLAQSLFLKKSVYPEILILEYAADRPGDIKELLEIAKPYIGIITAIGEIPVHIEFFSGPEAIVREKARVVENLSANGFAVLNFDNEAIINMKERTRAKIITFGFNEGADVKISGFDYAQTNANSQRESALSPRESAWREAPMGVSFKIEYAGSFVPVVLKNVFGKAQAYAAAVAACVGLIFDLNLVEISEALSINYRPAKGRMNLLKGIKDTYIINDAYNASPISMEEALTTLGDLSAERKIAVLGDMLELGKYSVEAHESIGRLAGKIVDVLITVGPRAKFIAESAEAVGLDKNKILSFDTTTEACRAVQDLIKKGDLILIKASRAIGLEEIVEEIKEIAAFV